MRISEAGCSATAVIVLMIMTWTVEAHANQLRDELTELCDEERAVCLDLFRGLIGDGVLDQDRDGVSDLADRCPGTPTAIARAQRILLDQESALTAIRELFSPVSPQLRSLARLISVVRIDPDVHGETERAFVPRFAGQLAMSFDQLLALSNSQSGRRFLFGGLLDRRAPFEIEGDFGLNTVPAVRYFGDQGVLELSIGRLGKHYPITVPGDYLLLGDLDGDGLYPDLGGVDLFGLLADANTAVLNRDVDEIIRLLGLADRAVDILIVQIQRTEELFQLTTGFIPSPAASAVDADGCTQEQFCSGINIDRRKKGRICESSDFRNDEPLRRRPKDCRLVEAEGRDLRCSARSSGRDRDDRRKRQSGRKH